MPKKSGAPKPAPAIPPTRDTVFDPNFLEDLRWWITKEPKTAERVLVLVDAVMRDPLKGIGKPEPLKYWHEAAWSRRVTQEDRLVYVVQHDRISFLQCRYHN